MNKDRIQRTLETVGDMSLNGLAYALEISKEEAERLTSELVEEKRIRVERLPGCIKFSAIRKK